MHTHRRTKLNYAMKVGSPSILTSQERSPLQRNPCCPISVGVNILGVHKAWLSPTSYTKGSGTHLLLPPAVFTYLCIL